MNAEMPTWFKTKLVAAWIALFRFVITVAHLAT
jgi:hypothetical protein